ncbi:MAG: hypothetical protein MK082_04240 [Phycisphaerales bacterium]|nr:hypothetical protein [Phycisphaerales bacterium]
MSSHNEPITEQIDDPESGWTWFLSLASIIILIVTVVACTVLYYVFEDMEIEEKVIDVPAEEFTDLRDQQELLLDEYQTYSVIPMGGTPEDAESMIRIPVEKAMEILVAESRSDRADATQSEDSTELVLLDTSNGPSEGDRR